MSSLLILVCISTTATVRVKFAISGRIYMAELDINELRNKSTNELIGLMSSMHTGLSGSVKGAQEESARQAIQCLIEEKLTYALTNAMNKLDESTTWLSKVGIAISIIGVT